MNWCVLIYSSVCHLKALLIWSSKIVYLLINKWQWVANYDFVMNIETKLRILIRFDETVIFFYWYEMVYLPEVWHSFHLQYGKSFTFSYSFLSHRRWQRVRRKLSQMFTYKSYLAFDILRIITNNWIDWIFMYIVYIVYRLR